MRRPAGIIGRRTGHDGHSQKPLRAARGHGRRLHLHRHPRPRLRRALRLLARPRDHLRARRLHARHHHADSRPRRPGHRRVRHRAARHPDLRRDSRGAAQRDHRGRGRRLLQPRRLQHPPHRDDARLERPRGRPDGGGGQHHHHAARPQRDPGRPEPRPREDVAAQDRRGLLHDSDRETLHEARDPDPLRQPDLAGHGPAQRVRGRGRFAPLLRQARDRARARRGGHHRRHVPDAGAVEPARQHGPRGEPPQPRAAADGRRGLRLPGGGGRRDGPAHRARRAAGAEQLHRALLHRGGPPAPGEGVRGGAALRGRVARRHHPRRPPAGGGQTGRRGGAARPRQAPRVQAPRPQHPGRGGGERRLPRPDGDPRDVRALPLAAADRGGGHRAGGRHRRRRRSDAGAVRAACRAGRAPGAAADRDARLQGIQAPRRNARRRGHQPGRPRRGRGDRPRHRRRPAGGRGRARAGAAGRGRAPRRREPDRPHPRDGGRLRLRPQQVQPRDAGLPAARLALQGRALRRRHRHGVHHHVHRAGRADRLRCGAGAAALPTDQLRLHLRGPDHAPAGARKVAQRSRRLDHERARPPERPRLRRAARVHVRGPAVPVGGPRVGRGDAARGDQRLLRLPQPGRADGPPTRSTASSTARARRWRRTAPCPRTPSPPTPPTS